jgi:predicted acetyltransferase
MAPAEIRTVTNAEELRDAAGAIAHYFGREKPDEAWTERWLKNFELERMHAALDDGSIVGGAGALTLRMTVPGGAALPCAGVTVVGVLPTHRRRGILRSMMRAQLDDVHERGEPIAALWASEETIYNRYGYGLASLSLALDIPRVHGAFRSGIGQVGRVRLVDAAEAAKLVPPVYDAVRNLTPGMYERSPAWWGERILADLPEFRFGAGPKLYAVLEVGGVGQGYAIYRLNASFGNLGPETKVQTQEVIAATSAATASIWRYLLDVDWTQTIAARTLAVDHPLLLLLARLNLSRPTLSDGLWVRLVDVGDALSGRSYVGEGAVVLDVRDEFCEWNAGRWKVEAGATVRTGEDPDLALDVATLGSVYLGGFTFRELSRAQQVEELREGGLARADELFRTDVAPWCPEIF